MDQGHDDNNAANDEDNAANANDKALMNSLVLKAKRYLESYFPDANVQWENIKKETKFQDLFDDVYDDNEENYLALPECFLLKAVRNKVHNRMQFLRKSMLAQWVGSEIWRMLKLSRKDNFSKLPEVEEECEELGKSEDFLDYKSGQESGTDDEEVDYPDEDEAGRNGANE